MKYSKDVLDLDDDPADILGAGQEAQVRWALDYIVTSYDETEIKSRKEKLRDNLKDWIIANCEPDENGSYIYTFDNPIVMDDKTYQGLIAQRRVSEFVNEDKAYAVAEKYDVLDQVTEEVITTELSLDKMYSLNQQGIIPDEDIDSILELKETFALTKWSL
jgi:hypothetical protein